MDYSTVARRREACEPEIRVNRRAAPTIYRQTRAVVRPPDGRIAWDRGMISAATIAALEERGLDYILGARVGHGGDPRDLLKNERPFTPLWMERGYGETQIFVKQVTADRAHYIVCRNEAEAEKDRAERQAILADLGKRLSSGYKALVGKAGWRRYLRRTGASKAFEINAGKLAEEAHFDGIFVLSTNACMTPLDAVLRYKELLLVEELFRRAKVQLRRRSIYHSSDAAIRGHVFCSLRWCCRRSCPTSADSTRSVSNGTI